MTTTDRDSVIERVKKLLALAGSNTNVNEAAAAMARAQKLMLEHKLAAAELVVDGDAQEEIGGINVDEPGTSCSPGGRFSSTCWRGPPAVR